MASHVVITCGDPLLGEFVQGIISVPGVVDEQTAAEYSKIMKEATQRKNSAFEENSNLNTIFASGSRNQTLESKLGAGTDLSQQPPDTSKSTPDNYVEGYEMTKETVIQPESSSSTFSGSDIVAVLLVALAAVAVFIGFMKEGKI